MTQPQYEVLVQLSEAPGGELRMAELAAAAMTSRSRLTYQVDQLEKARLIRRSSCPTDERGVVAALTEEAGTSCGRQLPAMPASSANGSSTAWTRRRSPAWPKDCAPWPGCSATMRRWRPATPRKSVEPRRAGRSAADSLGRAIRNTGETKRPHLGAGRCQADALVVTVRFEPAVQRQSGDHLALCPGKSRSPGGCGQAGRLWTSCGARGGQRQVVSSSSRRVRSSAGPATGIGAGWPSAWAGIMSSQPVWRSV